MRHLCFITFLPALLRKANELTRTSPQIPPPAWKRVPAYFGYQPVSPGEKRRLVQDHFDTVARRYDLTNTLLSFGLQHRLEKDRGEPA